MYVLDYVFYRVCKYYKMMSGDSGMVGFYSCTILSLITFFTCLNIFILACITLEKDLKISKLLVTVCIIILQFMFSYRYRNTIYLHTAIRKSKNYNKVKIGFYDIIIVCYLLTIVLTPMVLGYMRHNLGMKF